MWNRLILSLLGYINNISGSPDNINMPYIYESHKIFKYSLSPESLSDIHSYLPCDLYDSDVNKIESFIQNYKGNKKVTFVFYKDNNNTYLKDILTGDENYQKRVVIHSNKNISKKSVANNFLIECDEKNLKVELINHLGSINNIKEILSILNTIVHHYSDLDNNVEVLGFKKFTLVFKDNKLIAVKVIDKIKNKENPNQYKLRKNYFYILNLGNRKLLVNQNGLVIPGDMMVINNQLPLKNAAENLGSKFGYRIHPILRKRLFHSGQDIRAPMGTEIYGMADGIVVFSGYNRTYGYVIVIYHGNQRNEGYSTLYAHCSKLLVQTGAYVRKGQIIALVGSTGRSSGPHLHFEVINNSSKKRLNPTKSYNLSVKRLPPFLIKYFIQIKNDSAKILNEN